MTSGSKTLSWSQALARRLVRRHLTNLQGGTLQIIDHESDLQFGTVSDLGASIHVEDPKFYERIVWGGGLGAAESLMAGEWKCNDLTSFVRIFIRNLALADRMDRGTAWGKRLFASIAHALRRNTIHNARKNIQQHYDLSNDFYKLWLDESMTYSCGLFADSSTSMHEASLAKIDLACKKLRLKPSDHLVEIGTGWGALSIHAAKHYGCRVTTTTISDAQYQYARERIHQEGLSDRITLLKEDYRKLTGEYDKLVSIEMIEAVGHHYFPDFFQKCGELLKPDGAGLIQAIVISDARYHDHLRSVDFIKKYIFPGGCLPSIADMTLTASRSGSLRLLQLEDYAAHYAETLRRWHSKFNERLSEIRAQGFDEPFIRMWRYYLCYCEAVFEERQVNLVQALFGKPKCSFSFWPPQSAIHDRIPGDPAATTTLATPNYSATSPTFAESQLSVEGGATSTPVTSATIMARDCIR